MTGDKDFVKRLMVEPKFEILFGRVNMKPGKPMTFAWHKNSSISYFALPGNPVSAYVTFLIFVLPALRFMCGFPLAKCSLPVVNTILSVDKYKLDPRPEFARARISYSNKKGLYYSHMPMNQMSSKINSLINADALLQLPGGSDKTPCVHKGNKLKALIINHHFISSYED